VVGVELALQLRARFAASAVHIRALMLIGALISKMTLLFTIVVDPNRWGLGCILSSLGSLHILIPSAWTMKVVGTMDHLTLRVANPCPVGWTLC
jgi:hypothetical protein